MLDFDKMMCYNPHKRTRRHPYSSKKEGLKCLKEKTNILKSIVASASMIASKVMSELKE